MGFCPLKSAFFEGIIWAPLTLQKVVPIISNFRIFLLLRYPTGDRGSRFRGEDEVEDDEGKNLETLTSAASTTHLQIK